MPDSMKLRIAKVIAEKPWHLLSANGRRNALITADAVLTEMFEATETMQTAGGNCGGFEFDGERGIIWPLPIWRAMIGAALGEDAT